MSAFPSTYLIPEIFNLISTGTKYLALYTTDPTVDDTGNEATGGSYARQIITFSALATDTISNSNEITFPGLPGGTITHWGIKDHLTAGDLYVFGEFTTPILVDTGDSFIFSVGEIDLSLSGS